MQLAIKPMLSLWMFGACSHLFHHFPSKNVNSKIKTPTLKRMKEIEWGFLCANEQQMNKCNYCFD